MKVRIIIEADLVGRCGEQRIERLALAAQEAVLDHDDPQMSVYAATVTRERVD